MTGHYTPEEIAAQLKDAHNRGKCQHEEKRADALVLVQRDIAKLICTVIDYFSHLVIKRGELALVIGTRGDLRSLTVTLELIRHKQRIAYLSYRDPLLRIEDRGRRDCMAERQAQRAAHPRLRSIAAESSRHARAAVHEAADERARAHAAGGLSSHSRRIS